MDIGVTMSRKVRLWVAALVLSALFACSGTVEHGDGGDPKTPEQAATQFCAKMVALACEGSRTQATCEAAVGEERARAEGQGCLAEFDAVVRCSASADLSCTVGVQDACPAEFNQYDTCNAPDEACLIGRGGLQPGAPECEISCADYAAVCMRPVADQPLDCTCTSGALSGQKFSLGACTELSPVSETACRP